MDLSIQYSASNPTTKLVQGGTLGAIRGSSIARAIQSRLRNYCGGVVRNSDLIA
jgi:hypothetical protein